jgi:hypothetical protein
MLTLTVGTYRPMGPRIWNRGTELLEPDMEPGEDLPGGSVATLKGRGGTRVRTTERWVELVIEPVLRPVEHRPDSLVQIPIGSQGEGHGSVLGSPLPLPRSLLDCHRRH